MPNWVANHLTIHGENAANVLRSLLIEDKESDDGVSLDFNKIKPMPGSLKIESGSVTDSCIELYMTSKNPLVDYYGTGKMPAKKFLKLKNGLNDSPCYTEYNVQLSPDELDSRLKSLSNHFDTPDFESLALGRGKTAVDNFENYGAKDWYDWAITNWGSKWNACNCQVYENDIYFDTAWSSVPRLIQELSRQYPNNKFEYEFAEEQAGYYAGYFVFEGGNANTANIYDSYNKESYEMFFKLWGLEDEFKYNDKTGTYEYIDTENEM